MSQNNYYIGIDAGTNSVGWAVTDAEYDIIKKNGKTLWGARLFDDANTAEKRRLARSSRRRGDRRSYRLALLRELFKTEIAKADPAFYIRLDESKFWEEDKKVQSRFCLFNDREFNDVDYHREYPTIYHLRRELMNSPEPHDVRLVYLAAAHIIKHRGNFLMQMSPSDSQPDFMPCWEVLTEDAREILDINISCSDIDTLQKLMRKKMPVREKQKKLQELISVSVSPDAPEFKCIYELLAGKTSDVSKSFGIKLEGEEKNSLKISFSSDDMENEEKLEIYHSYLEDGLQVIMDLKAIYDWGILVGILHGSSSISEAKISSYEKHGSDLKRLQALIKKECPDKYSECFRYVKKNLNNYCAYTGHYDRRNPKNCEAAFKCSQEDFYKYIRSLIKNSKSKAAVSILEELELGTFLPLQRSKENSVIPYQMNLHELQKILDNASAYLPFLKDTDADGISVKEKVESLLTYRVPYYVGPLDNTNAKPGTHWAVKRHPEIKALPWNFDEVVDKEASAEKFMAQLTNMCTYLIGESVVPKDSVIYSRFMALNELNNVTVFGNRLPLEIKQKAFNELFMKKSQVRRKALENFLRSEGIIKKGEEEAVGGIDGDFKASLKTELRLREIFEGSEISAEQMDSIILSVLLLKQEPNMLRERISKICPGITGAQLKKVCSLSCSGWGRFSRKFLTGLKAQLPDTGTDRMSILDALWNTQYNLMELLANHMPYKALIDECNSDMLDDAKLSYETVEKLSAPPAVRRTIWQTMRIVEEITHIMGGAPAKIFVEMAKGASGSGRTVSRKYKLMDCYRELGKEGAAWTEKLDRYDEARLRQDKLFLYFTQMGRCMYTGDSIDLDALLNDSGNQIYDIDHIYPRSKVKDDSLDNRVLVLKTVNLNKDNTYPIESGIRKKQFGFWSMLRDRGLISKIKFERLTRASAFTDDELAGFISRQLVETRQSTKLMAQILQSALPDSRIIYVKAGNVSDFRRLFDLIKVRDLNDLHHAKDAYLNIVVGNVYDVKFTSNPKRFIQGGESYSMKPEVLFKHTVKRGAAAAWDEHSIERVKRNYRRNNIMLTRLAVRRNSGQNGGFYDQNPVRDGTIPLNGDPRLANTARYGGYRGDTGAYMMLVEHGNKKKRTRTLVPMYLRFAERADSSPSYPEEYCREELGLTEPKVIIPEIRFNTLMESKGFKFRLTGRSEGRVLGIQEFQMVLSDSQEKYLKKVLKVCERIKASKEELHIDEKYDGICSRDNLALYDAFLEKLQLPVYSARPSSPLNTLKEGRKIFVKLSLERQCAVLSNVLGIFRGSGQADLTEINGKKNVNKIRLSNNVGSDFKIIHQSVTGFYSHEDTRTLK